MIEFDDYFNKIYSGKEAITRRLNIRCSHTTKDIPYYTRGINLNEFTYGNKSTALRIALRDFGADVRYDEKNNRIADYDVIIKVGE